MAQTKRVVDKGDVSSETLREFSSKNSKTWKKTTNAGDNLC